jgi:hypothetical protein
MGGHRGEGFWASSASVGRIMGVSALRSRLGRTTTTPSSRPVDDRRPSTAEFFASLFDVAEVEVFRQRLLGRSPDIDLAHVVEEDQGLKGALGGQ